MDSTGARVLARNIVLAAQISVESEQVRLRRERREWWCAIAKQCFDFLGFWGVAFIVFIVAFGTYHIAVKIQVHRHHQAMMNEVFPAAKDMLRLWLEEESPKHNVTLFGCPQGYRGFDSPFPENLTREIVDKTQNVKSRCPMIPPSCNYVTSVSVAMDALRKKHLKLDRRMMLGPIHWDHPYQATYCQRKIRTFCWNWETLLPACPIMDELEKYGESLVNAPCGSDHLMGASGPPSRLDAYQCDVFLQKKRMTN